MTAFAGLARWQAALEAETPDRLTAAAPPVIRQVSKVRVNGRDRWDVLISEEPAAALGQTLSGPMIRLLGHDEGYGTTFMVRRSLAAWNRYCRSRHQRWPDHRDRPGLCAEIAHAVIRDRMTIRFAADQTGISWLRAARLLVIAARWMRQRQEEWIEQAS